MKHFVPGRMTRTSVRSQSEPWERMIERIKNFLHCNYRTNCKVIRGAIKGPSLLILAKGESVKTSWQLHELYVAPITTDFRGKKVLGHDSAWQK